MANNSFGSSAATIRTGTLEREPFKLDNDQDRLLTFLTRLARFGLVAGADPLLKPVKPG